MSDVMIFWDPMGQQLDSVGTTKYIRATDGDTPYVSTSIRLLSIETPEVHYPGNQRPSNQNGNLAQLAEWIKEGKAPIEKELGKFLLPKLETGKAGTLQEDQGEEASRKFTDMVEEKLKRPSGKPRSVFIMAADEHFDQYGRLLAYMAPSYSAEERETMTREERATFNLLMIKSGWAASMMIYPSLPRHVDLVMFYEAANKAYKGKAGCWSDKKSLTGYEFRMCVKLFNITKNIVEGSKMSTADRYAWISRYCVDMTTRKIYNPQDYIKVEPFKRIFVWPDDVSEAVGTMNLLPGD
ncbi:MAG: thermonuclease family protein [Deltaproteobacteria bacterium]|uniref:Thermonuclease family protein n=1 Tax=Candidatus Zymogenus saltonus TaxID=2844893 RepID=A0A9D8PNK5_9DELT|nr:thermonuclease family protein [Candidatus Zymogenus saltonus]